MDLEKNILWVGLQANNRPSTANARHETSKTATADGISAMVVALVVSAERFRGHAGKRDARGQFPARQPLHSRRVGAGQFALNTGRSQRDPTFSVAIYP